LSLSSSDESSSASGMPSVRLRAESFPEKLWVGENGESWEKTKGPHQKITKK